MARHLIFISHRLNRNSLTPVVRALLGSDTGRQLRLSFAASAAEVAADADAIAWSFTTTELTEIEAQLRTVRRGRKPRPLLIAGGAHPTADPDGTLALGFDIVCVGEGERIALDVAERVLANDREPIVLRHAGPLIDLDDDLHVEPVHGLYPFVEITRGCPYHCAFCQVPAAFGHKLRHRSPAVVEQGIRLAVAAGFKRFRYLTPNAFAYRPGGASPIEALTELLERVAAAGASQQMLGSFPSEVRPDHVRPALLALLRHHCTNRTLVIGAQSGSDRVLDLMQRGHSVEQARAAIRQTAAAGLTPHVDILLGFPGERPEEQRASVELAHWAVAETHARIHGHVYLPLPGTPGWPRPPEKLDRTALARLHELRMQGQVDGWWEQQILQGKQIMRWRLHGKIKS